MSYNRPTDQYKKAAAPEMIKELNRKELCGISTIRNYKQILFGDGPHAGTLAHICGREKGHKEECECQSCGMRFLGWRD